MPTSYVRYIDWMSVGLYLVLVVAGVFSVYAASYDFDNASIFDFNEFSGKQVRWIFLALGLALMIMLIDRRMYETYAYPIYLTLLAIMVVTIFVAPDIKGSRSWLVFGPVSFQPANSASLPPPWLWPNCSAAISSGSTTHTPII